MTQDSSVKAANPQLLALVGTVPVRATGRFVADRKFVKKDSPIKIIRIDDNFRKWFSGKTEGPTTKTTLCCATLSRSSIDSPILAELGEKYETALAQIYALMKRQQNGKVGSLLTEGGSNVFYVRDADGNLRAVGVFWNDGGWDVKAYFLDDPSKWYAGNRVFYRNS